MKQQHINIKNNIPDSSFSITQNFCELSPDKAQHQLAAWEHRKCVGQSENYLSVLDTAKKMKGLNYNVLLQGETGTGKELLARYIHELENDPNRPFVTINCGAIPDNLFESELFGHEAGSFTGATKRHLGKFELANGGDIFLDEINTIKPSLQCKLLRVIQEQEFYRVGGSSPIKVNVRIIAASSVSLREEMVKENFRQDLFYRLNVFALTLPPLRERKKDIPLLANHFLKSACKGIQKQFSESAREHILNYPWPGNIRELKHTIESLAVLSHKQIITKEDLPAWMFQSTGNSTSGAVGAKFSKKISLNEYLNRAKKDYILQCVEHFNGNIFKAAQALNIARSTIYRTLNNQEP